MKLLVTCLMCLFIGQVSFGQKNDFYDNVLDDFQVRHGSFIAIDVESAEYTGRVIISNGDLYYFLSEAKGLDKKNYKEFVKKILINKEKLKLNNVSLSKSKDALITNGNNSVWFEIVKDSKEIEEIASKGKEKFIKNYFRKPVGILVINRGVKNWNSIINKLFEWKIVTSTDDETGYLVIDSYRSGEKF